MMIKFSFKNNSGYTLFCAKIKKLAIKISVIVLIVNSVGCSTIKPYPVCFSDCNAIDNDSRRKIVDSLAQYLKLESKEIIIHPSSKWILAKTNPIQHKRLIKIWPRMACIGDVTSGTEVTKNSQCVEYIYNFMKNKNYLEFDIDENPVHSDEAPGKPHIICCCEF